MENKKMTIYYRISNGNIDAFIPMEFDMNFYGDLKADYELTHSYIVLDYDEYVVNNIMNFKVVNKQLKLKNADDLNKYM